MAAAQHGGFIGMESTVGRGATRRAYLPAGEGAPPAPGAAPIPSKRKTGRESILLVEDENAVRALVREILEMHGYIVVEARDAEEALALTERKADPFDLLLTDVFMRGMTGRDLSDRLLARWPGLKVLYMSGYTEEVMIRLGIIENATPFIQKPFALDLLVEKVRAVMETRPRRSE